ELIKSMMNISKYDFSHLKALVVEDNYINMSIILEYLKSYGISVEKAENGIEAIKMFFDSPIGYYNIIFMDIMMPKMNGMSATKIIRDSTRLDSQLVPIVAMTANTLYEELNKYYEIGMNYQLIKPFDKVHLTEILAREFT
ncbi:MAG: response regulator, partial [Clostridia bacterium]